MRTVRWPRLAETTWAPSGEKAHALDPIGMVAQHVGLFAAFGVEDADGAVGAARGTRLPSGLKATHSAISGRSQRMRGLGLGARID